MPFDAHTSLWSTPDDVFFRDRIVTPLLQHGPHCVATSLAMLSESSPDRFIGSVNTQNPSSWSDALAPWHLQLAYCPTDVRKLIHYRDELLKFDDVFTLSY